MFNASMFDPESLNKGTPGIAAGNQACRDGAPIPALQGVQRSRGYQIDPAISDLRGGATAGQPISPVTARGNTSTAPGEPVQAVAVPAIAKADANRPAPDGWTNGGRTPQDHAGHPVYRDPAGSTSGSATPLAANRHERRPGAGRHPESGRFTDGQGIAAGHPLSGPAASGQERPDDAFRSDRPGRPREPVRKCDPVQPGQAHGRGERGDDGPPRVGLAAVRQPRHDAARPAPRPEPGRPEQLRLRHDVGPHPRIGLVAVPTLVALHDATDGYGSVVDVSNLSRTGTFAAVAVASTGVSAWAAVLERLGSDGKWKQIGEPVELQRGQGVPLHGGLSNYAQLRSAVTTPVVGGTVTVLLTS